jgi:hypothetical protein
MIYFTLSVLTHDAIGGVGGLYDKVLAVEAAGEVHVEGNYLGSLLTFKSKEAIMFGLIVKIGNLALVFMVRSYIPPLLSAPLPFLLSSESKAPS